MRNEAGGNEEDRTKTGICPVRMFDPIPPWLLRHASAGDIRADRVVARAYGSRGSTSTTTVAKTSCPLQLPRSELLYYTLRGSNTGTLRIAQRRTSLVRV